MEYINAKIFRDTQWPTNYENMLQFSTVPPATVVDKAYFTDLCVLYTYYPSR